MGKGIAVIEYEQCMACWCCVQACPLDCLKNTKTGLDAYKKVYPELKALGRYAHPGGTRAGNGRL